MSNLGNAPGWVRTRRESLWKAFGDAPFKTTQAREALDEPDDDSVNVILSELRKAGWLSTEPSDEDKRVKVHRIAPPSKVVSDIIGANSINRSEMNRILKRAADLIRTRVDYKFILILLFYKRISDLWTVEYEKTQVELIQKGIPEEIASQEARKDMYHDFSIPTNYLWDEIRKDVAKLPEKFSDGLRALAEANEPVRDVLNNADFIQFARSRENSEILRQLVELFSERKLDDVSNDVLGDAYEWILQYFAPSQAKEGEVYTPREVIELMVDILDPKRGASVYDPACGSGGMLITAYKYVERTQGKESADRLHLYGQEQNEKTRALGIMNLYIHGIKNGNLAGGDTLLYPKFEEAGRLKRFDHVLANPPWNLKGYPESVLKKGASWESRFPHGFPNKSSADWAWVQHMLASAQDDGKVAVIFDNGLLFRGGKEGAIRTKVLDKDLLETVILLPEKLFYNTGAPGCIAIFNKAKPTDRRGKVLFVNASTRFGKHPDVRKLNVLRDEDISAIVSAYREFSDTEGFSRVVTRDDLKAFDDNLNVSLYVYEDKERETIDVETEWEKIMELENEIKASLENVRKVL
jgi:type I restriction enzyme M protein